MTTWGSIYRKWLAKGEDHGSAAYRADEWEKRQARKPVFGVPNSPGYDDAGFSEEFVAAFHAYEDARDA